MPQQNSQLSPVHEALDAVYRLHSRHVFATLVRLLGDFDVAEEALQDAFRAALEQWPSEGYQVIQRRGWFRPGASRGSI